MLVGLQASVLNSAAVNYAFKSFEQGLLRAIENRGCETSLLDRKIAELDTKIHNCTAAIAEGHPFKSLLEQVGLLEAEMQQAKSERENIRPEGLKARLRDTRRFVEANPCNLRELLSGEARMARAELAKHIQRIVLTPHGKTFVAAGNWSLLGLGYYDGAGGGNWTETSAHSIWLVGSRSVKFARVLEPVAALPLKLLARFLFSRFAS